MATEATFRSRCGICDETIYEGDMIDQVDGEWCHEDCAEDEIDFEDTITIRTP